MVVKKKRGGQVRESRVREMTELERAWVAGLLEGEGSFFVAPRPGKPSQGRVSCGMTDQDVMQKLVETIGVGRVTPVDRSGYPNTFSKKISYFWAIGARNDVLSVIEQLYDLMGERRRSQMDAVRAALHDGDQEAAA